MGVPEILDPLAQLALPPGFRFYPTDEELLVQYLCRKVAGHHFNLQIIGEIDLYKFDPWVLPSKALFGEKEWYFFSPRERKYPNGSRPNRVAGSGYWKATGTDKIITTDGRKVGIKKALVFYVGKAPKGLKTNWIMHEYRLIESSRKHGSPKLDECVLCRIYKKSSASSNQKPMQSFSSKEHSYGGSTSSSSSHLDDVLESLPDIENRFFSLPRINSLNQNDEQKLKFQSFGSGSSLDWAMLAELNSELELGTSTGGGGGGGGGGQIQSQTQAIMNSNNVCNDKYVPFVPQISQVEPQLPKQRIKIDEELLSGFRNQQNPNVYQSSFINSTDSFGYRYPTTQSSGYGFRQGSK